MTQPARRFEVNYLLALSRFPDQFYPLVKGLQGRDVIYCNPGTSLRSFVLSGSHPLNEFIEVGEPMLSIIEECEDFCDDQDVIKEVHNAMMKQPYEVIEQIVVETGDSLTSAEMMKCLKSLNMLVEDAYETLKRNSLGGNLSLFTPPGKDYKQTLFDLKQYAGELVDALEHLRNKKA